MDGEALDDEIDHKRHRQHDEAVGVGGQDALGPLGAQAAGDKQPGQTLIHHCQADGQHQGRNLEEIVGQSADSGDADGDNHAE